MGLQPPPSGSGSSHSAAGAGFNDTFHSQMSELSGQEQRLQNELRQMKKVGNGKRKTKAKPRVAKKGLQQPPQQPAQQQQGSARFGRRAAAPPAA